MSASVPSNGLELCYESFGDPAHDNVLLIAGYGQQMTDWDDEFCVQLADAGFHVVRFDNRDTGLSTHLVDVDLPDVRAGLAGELIDAPYTVADMARDALGLLVALDIQHTHVVGHSLGAMIGQSMAIESPDQVMSLVSMASTTGDPKVSRLDPALLSAGQEIEDPFERSVARSSERTSWKLGTTEAELRARLRKRMDRAYDPAGQARQLGAILASPDRTSHLRQLDIPCAVIHGSDDPLIDVRGGEATASAIPDAELVVIERMRHDLPRSVWPLVIDVISRTANRADV